MMYEAIHVSFKKIEDGRWCLCRADSPNCNRVEHKWVKQVIERLKEDFDITVEAKMLDKHSYKIVIAFDNDADEAEFIFRASSNELILKLVDQSTFSYDI